MEENEKTITPSQYFDYLKDAKNTITSESLKNSYDTFITLGEKYKRIGQTESLKKLCFLAETLIKEEKLVEMGITTYVYKDVVEDYIEHVAEKTVKIIELSRYMREIPDELVEVIEKTKDIFDQFYVVFTDYTGKVERQIEKERRDKDPILFGVFKDGTVVADRFYFLGDWVDEYCDLTLDKLVAEYKEKKNGEDPTVTTEIPQTSEELLAVLKSYQPKEDKGVQLGNSFDIDTDTDYAVPLFVKKNTDEKKSFIDKVRSVFKK